MTMSIYQYDFNHTRNSDLYVLHILSKHDFNQLESYRTSFLPLICTAIFSS